MTLIEQETVICFNRAEKEMTIYTANPATMRRLSKLAAYKKVGEGRQQGEVVSMTFTADKSLLTLRAKKKTFTDKQRETARRNMAKIHSGKN